MTQVKAAIIDFRNPKRVEVKSNVPKILLDSSILVLVALLDQNEIINIVAIKDNQRALTVMSELLNSDMINSIRVLHVLVKSRENFLHYYVILQML